MPTPQIFTRKHYDDLKAAQRTIHDVLPVMDKAEACGMECREFRDRAKYLSEMLSLIEKEFMTPPPER